MDSRTCPVVRTKLQSLRSLPGSPRYRPLGSVPDQFRSRSSEYPRSSCHSDTPCLLLSRLVLWSQPRFHTDPSVLGWMDVSPIPGDKCPAASCLPSKLGAV